MALVATDQHDLDGIEGIHNFVQAYRNNFGSAGICSSGCRAGEAFRYQHTSRRKGGPLAAYSDAYSWKTIYTKGREHLRSLRSDKGASKRDNEEML